MSYHLVNTHHVDQLVKKVASNFNKLTKSVSGETTLDELTRVSNKIENYVNKFGFTIKSPKVEKSKSMNQTNIDKGRIESILNPEPKSYFFLTRICTDCKRPLNNRMRTHITNQGVRITVCNKCGISSTRRLINSLNTIVIPPIFTCPSSSTSSLPSIQHSNSYPPSHYASIKNILN